MEQPPASPAPLPGRSDPGPLFAWASRPAPEQTEKPERAAPARPPAPGAGPALSGKSPGPHPHPTPPGATEVTELLRMLELRYSARLGYPLAVELSRAFASPVRLEVQRGPEGRRGRLRLHHCLPLQDVELQAALEMWLCHGRRARAASNLIDRAIATLSAARPKPVPRQPLLAGGRFHNLELLLGEVLAHPRPTPLAELVEIPRIGWGRFAFTPPRRSLWLGSYDSRCHAIRVHPVLDDRDVPTYFLRSILYHELLHAALPIERGPSGQRLLHGPRFRAAERSHPDYAPALEYQRRTLSKLLSAARRGSRQQAGNTPTGRR